MSSSQTNIKNYAPLQNTTNDDLVVKYIDMNDDKENMYTNSKKASNNNFAF